MRAVGGPNQVAAIIELHQVVSSVIDICGAEARARVGKGPQN